MLKHLLWLSLILSSCSTTYYIVRHAEKEPTINMMTTDVPLSAMGIERAKALKEKLKNSNIKAIYATNFIRNRATVQPLSEVSGIPVQLYDPRDSNFVGHLKSIRGKKLLIAGHSNTVDDLVNGLTGKNLLQDLPDTQYGDLFIVRKKMGRYYYSRDRFGQ